MLMPLVRTRRRRGEVDGLVHWDLLLKALYR